MGKYGGEKLYDMLCDIVDEVEEKKELSMSDLEKAEKATTIKKNLLKIEKMENDDGYSQEGDWRAERSYRGRSSYGRDGSSYRRRDSMGRYARNRDNYSMIDHIDDMMAEASTPEERDMIQRFRREMQR